MNFLYLPAVMLDATGTTSQPTQAGETEAASEGINFLEVAMNGGWIMIPLVLLSLIAVYIFFERYMVIRKARKDAPYFMSRIREYIVDGKKDAAIKVCQETQAPYAAMIEKGISRMGKPLADIQAAIENVGNLQVAKLEKGFTMLATISSGAPMIGFLGTVIGMIKVFYKIKSVDGPANPGQLSEGIYQALTTTVAGLIVGIIAMFAYNYLVSQLDKTINEMEAKTSEFMDVVNDEENNKIEL